MIETREERVLTDLLDDERLSTKENQFVESLNNWWIGHGCLSEVQMDCLEDLRKRVETRS
jgi:hypothetical protein